MSLVRKSVIKVTVKVIDGTEGCRGIALVFNVGARGGWLVNATPRPLYPWDRNPVPIVQEAGWAPRADLDGC